MMSMIWSFWWRHKERFIMMMLGIFIISTGLSLLFSLSESNNGTVTDTLQKKWNVSYDIVVHPPGTSFTDEENGLFEPNFISGITGGISIDQFKKIQQMPEIEIAALLAVIGYSSVMVELSEVAAPTDFGVYRYTTQVTANNGVQDQTTNSWTSYMTNGLGVHPNEKIIGTVGTVTDMQGISLQQTATDYALLVGIDPEAEAKLVGLDEAIIPLKRSMSRYFMPTDKSAVEILDQPYFSSNQIVRMPVLMSSQLFADKTYTYRLEKLKLPYETEEEAKQTREKIKANGVEEYLNTIDVSSHQIYTFTSEDAIERVKNDLSGFVNGTPGLMIQQKATALSLESTESPFPDRWPWAYKLKTFSAHEMAFETYPEYYRPYEPLIGSQPDGNAERIVAFPDYIGMYDPSLLQVSKDIESHFPMETYRIPTAAYVMDDEGRPVNPQATIKPINNPLGFLTSPPTLLTTLEAAQFITGDKPISVIRVKVAGINEATEQSRAELERIAMNIRSETGLLADVTLGSSPQPVLIHVPESGTQTVLGWIEQQWIKLGAAVTLVTEVKLGFSGMIVLVLFVAAVYVLTTNLVSFHVRERQFAIMLSIGWRYSQIYRLLAIEALVLGSFVALITWFMTSAYAFFDTDLEITLANYLVLGLIGFVVYFLGSVAPMLLIRKISPMKAIRAGSIIAYTNRLKSVNSLFHLAFIHFNRKIKRNLLSVISMTVPSTLLSFLIFVTFHLKGVFYTSWIGQYAAAEIGSMHYLAVGICLLISILTAAEIAWQNVSESQPEISLYKAIGWRAKTIRKLFIWEGIIAGTFAGLLSVLLGLVFITAMYRKFPLQEIGYLLIVGIVPILSGLLGSWIPAGRAASLKALIGMTEIVSPLRRTELWMKTGLITFVIVSLFVVFAEIGQIMIKNPTEHSATLEEKSKQTVVKEPVPNKSQATYDLDLMMNDKGLFSVRAKISVTNISSQNWDKLVFYMIPNVFTDEDNSQTYRPSARFHMKDVSVNGRRMEYILDEDQMSILLQNKLQTNESTEVEITYDFTVPEDGIRYSRIGDRYYLAQWYPMLATYTGDWNKDPYTSVSESYNTDFSDFKLKYKLPEGFRVISSSDEDPELQVSEGQISVNNVRELMVVAAKELEYVSKRVHNVDIRLWGIESSREQMDEALDIAVNAFDFYYANIGEYPHNQLDVVLDVAASMEYPGIVTVGISNDLNAMRHSIAHEIAHQWFYGIVSNDPYSNGWLDEGITELSASLFLNDFSYSEQFYKMGGKKSNLPLSYYERKDIVSALYAQPVIKLKQLFDAYGGREKAIEFLKAYFSQFRYKQINTVAFMDFVKKYFSLSEEESFFDDWISFENSE